MAVGRLLRFASFAIAMTTAAPVFAAIDRVFWNSFEAPIDATANQWTWVDFPDTQCGDGSATGLGINPSTLSNRVLIYLAGGGACWDAATCYIFDTASNFNSGYGASDFAADVVDTGTLAQPGGFFDRSEATNPFKDYSYVVVPYCTGDIFAGDNVVNLGSGHIAHFVGYRNMDAYLRRLAATFVAPGRVVIAGSSAGGLGAAYNWWQAQNAFPQTQVYMIDDSGTPMPEDVLPQPNATELTQRANWNIAATLPPGCTGCETAFDVFFGFYASALPDDRGALLSFNPDTVLPLFYGISGSAFSTGLGEVETQQFDPSTNLRYWQINSAGHVLWTHPASSVNGTTVRDFITRMVNDDANWDSVKP